jgi:hypothetical protein
MITIKEVRAALTGIVDLAKGDIIGLAYFENTPRALARSFWAALIVAPAWVLLLAVQEQPATAGPVKMIVVQAIEYALLWTAFPVLLHEILARTGGPDRFCLYVAIRNWASLIETPAMLLAAAFVFAVPYDAAQFVPLFVVVAVFAFEWFLARVGLAVGIGAAAGVAALDFLLSITIQLTADLMLGVGAVIDAGAAQP